MTFQEFLNKRGTLIFVALVVLAIIYSVYQSNPVYYEQQSLLGAVGGAAAIGAIGGIITGLFKFVVLLKIIDSFNQHPYVFASVALAIILLLFGPRRSAR